MGYVKLKQINANNIEGLAEAMGWKNAAELYNELCLEESELMGKWSDFIGVDAEDFYPGLPPDLVPAEISPVFIIVGGRVFFESAMGWIDGDNNGWLEESVWEGLF